MAKNLFIAEKPSVAREFARAMGLKTANREGYLEAEEAVVTWCLGHLVKLSYPEAYDKSYKRWSFATIPFIPEKFKYEVIANVKQQFKVVSSLLNRSDIATIYVCTDSGREGEYIYRLVEKQAGVKGKERRRVWIDSQTEAEILRGIRESKDLQEYDNLSAAAHLRAQEDYLMGINFSRALTLKYSDSIKNFLKTEQAVIAVGRVMTCVLGIVVKREREIRNFVKTPYFRVIAKTTLAGQEVEMSKEKTYQDIKEAQALIDRLRQAPPEPLTLIENVGADIIRPAPLLYNLAELQNDCAKLFKISPDETLRLVQELYEKKLVTYPRTDARVLSSAVSKEIASNIKGLTGFAPLAGFAQEVITEKRYDKLAKSRYVNDKQITDHYAIIPTGQGIKTLDSLAPTARQIYELIARRFLSIFYPPAVYQKVSVAFEIKGERFTGSFKALAEEGYLKVAKKGEGEEQEKAYDLAFIQALAKLKPGYEAPLNGLEIKEAETKPPKRYNSGALILTMENAGQFIEDEELRAQIKGSGIGTSATRAEILKKLVSIKYLNLNKKTQIITPTLLGEMIYDVVDNSLRALLDPALTASWEKGLGMVAQGEISEAEYMAKLKDFIERRTNQVKQAQNVGAMKGFYEAAAMNYRK
jgi:DNA topoisomerase-3